MLLHAALAPPAPLPTLVTPEAVGGLVAFQVLVADGHLDVVHGDAAVAAGAPVTPRLRLLALARRAPARTVVGRSSAAWVHLGGVPDGALCVLYSPERHRPAPRPALASHQAVLRTDEVMTLGSAAVTTPPRTAADVALYSPEPAALRTLTELVSRGLVDEGDVLAVLARRRESRAYGRARALLEAACAQDGSSVAFEPVMR